MFYDCYCVLFWVTAGHAMITCEQQHDDTPVSSIHSSNHYGLLCAMDLAVCALTFFFNTHPLVRLQSCIYWFLWSAFLLDEREQWPGAHRGLCWFLPLPFSRHMPQYLYPCIIKLWLSHIAYGGWEKCILLQCVLEFCNFMEKHHQPFSS